MNFGLRRTPSVRFTAKVTREVIHHKSDHQDIVIFDTEELFRILVLDNYLMRPKRRVHLS